MDAVILLHPDAGLTENEAVVALATRVRTMGGVLAQVLDAEGEGLPGSEDDLVVTAADDVFDEVPDLADGLADMGIDRVVLLGTSPEFLVTTATGALAHQFDVTAVTDVLDGEVPAVLDEYGIVQRELGDLWLRM